MNLKFPFKFKHGSHDFIFTAKLRDCGTMVDVFWNNEDGEEHDVDYTLTGVESSVRKGVWKIIEEPTIDPLVEIRQSEYTALVEEINLLQELLAEANQKLANVCSQGSEEFKPVIKYTVQDWEQAMDEGWVFELHNGTVVFVKGIMDEFNDKDHPIELSEVGTNFHSCTVTLRGFMWPDERNSERSVKCRIK